MAPITTNVGGLMCFSYARLAFYFLVFFFFFFFFNNHPELSTPRQPNKNSLKVLLSESLPGKLHE